MKSNIAPHTRGEQKGERDHTGCPHRDWVVCCWVCTDERAHFNYKKINIQKTSTLQTETQSLIYNAMIAVAHRLVLAITFCQLSSHRAKTLSNTFKRYDGVCPAQQFPQLTIRNLLTEKYLLARLQKNKKWHKTTHEHEQVAYISQDEYSPLLPHLNTKCAKKML